MDNRIRNVLWMGIEKCISVIGVFVITAAMANYIGAFYFGAISYAASIFSLAYIVSSLGADSAIIRKGSIFDKGGEFRSLYIMLIRTLLYILISILVFIYLFLSKKIADQTLIFLIFSVFLSQLLLSLDFFSIINNYRLKSKINTLSNVIGLVIALVIRFVFVKIQVPVVYFSIPIVISPFVSLVIKCISTDISKLSYCKLGRINVSRSLKTVSFLFPFAITSISANIYNRIPLIFITSILGFNSAGVFSCALTFSTAWSFFPNSLISSFIPEFYKKSNGEDFQYLSKIIFMVFLCCLFISILIVLLVPYLIPYLYGSEYEKSINLVPAMLVSTVLGMIGNTIYHVFIKTKGYKFVMIKTLICAICSLFITFIAITYFKLLGGVLSLVLIEIISLFLMNGMYKKAKVNFILYNSFKLSTIRKLRQL